MKNFASRFTAKFSRYLLLSVLGAVYLALFFFLFFSKGIFVDGHFYKKSANLTTITYKAASIGADYDRIVLKKYIDYCTISLDDDATVTVYADGSTELEIYNSFTGQYSDEKWQQIATQKAERIRRFGSKPWFLPIVTVVLLFLAKRYSTQLYTFIFPHKAAGEGWYSLIDRAFYICLVLGLLYLIIPI